MKTSRSKATEGEGAQAPSFFFCVAALLIAAPLLFSKTRGKNKARTF
jgi:hypothetical protein